MYNSNSVISFQLKAEETESEETQANMDMDNSESVDIDSLKTFFKGSTFNHLLLPPLGEAESKTAEEENVSAEESDPQAVSVQPLATLTYIYTSMLTYWSLTV